MIVNVRGTNGSGKSTLVRNVMTKLTGLKPVTEVDGKKAIGYQGFHDGHTVSVVGRYETACGGCDTIKSQDLVVERVRTAAHFGSVLFEGVIVGDIYQRYATLADELGRHNFTFAFLDTPLQTCLDRVAHRREMNGKPPWEFDKSLVEQKWNNAQRQMKKFEAAGYLVTVLDHTAPVAVVMDILAEPTR